MGIKRKLPSSNVARRTALRVATERHEATGVASLLSANTAARLGVIYPSYKDKSDAVNDAEATSRQTTAVKDNAGKWCYLFSSHFLQNIMMAVDRLEMDKSVLAYYGLDQNSPSVPQCTTDQEIVDLAEAVVLGETNRVAAGGTALPLPTKLQVQAKLTAFNDALALRGTAAQTLRDAQTALNMLNTEADGVIKKIWDESNTFYNEQTDESRRASCRLWGVVYVSDTRISIIGYVMTIVNSEVKSVIANILLTESNEGTKSKANGSFELKSGFTGTATITIEAAGLQIKTITREIDGNGNIDLGEVTLVA